MNAMRPTISTVGNVLPALLGAVVVSIVLGIVGMHALNTHGVMSNADHAVMTGEASEHVAGQMAVTDEAATSVPGAAAATPAGGAGHGLGDMVMLCVAMLAAAAGILLLLLAGLRRIPRTWAHLPAAPTTVPQWFVARLGAGPPPEWEFSVTRC
ncbi:hypothetical protein [Nocardioides sp. InS609-2]|uniref:hypothetical protein n=1 Tax=Nocardioides sp. InS609-2 TaxID=2760705 RepID=UPI0020BFAF67|nr:hypothetical protein [Nocardioides sp. InS609-2]